MREFRFDNIIISHTLTLVIRNMATVRQHTLFHLVDSIRIKKFKLSRSSTPQTGEDENTTTKFWSIQEEHSFFNIILMYGADYSILKHHFPSKSRKQIKKKCTQIQQRKQRALERAQERKAQEKRKDFFDHQFMQLEMIKWRNSKPNKPGSATESDSN